MAEEDSPEESSWTFYIEGFMRDDNDNDNDDINSLSSASEMAESPSLVSDAASSAVVKKLSSSYYNCCVCRSNTDDDGDDGACRLGFKGSIRNMLIKQNSFKKQKTKVFLPSVMDYDLEDTASSPVNSPKVSYMNQFMNEKDKAKIDVSEEIMTILF
ncbi:hypothetical protein MIMGU_mgv1a022947mg [Erythranthe guttata]|uniref:Uncharacterized protein n=1 Tax=Erythranthe guttata TaxID=4155 RepID=A0A022PYC1_ERYGU|nr:hypothetical protein MIMGU_mgv1a022947mg [Erythranthe guttata]